MASRFLARQFAQLFPKCAAGLRILTINPRMKYPTGSDVSDTSLQLLLPLDVCHISKASHVRSPVDRFADSYYKHISGSCTKSFGSFRAVFQSFWIVLSVVVVDHFGWLWVILGHSLFQTLYVQHEPSLVYQNGSIFLNPTNHVSPFDHHTKSGRRYGSFFHPPVGEPHGTFPANLIKKDRNNYRCQATTTSTVT